MILNKSRKTFCYYILIKYVIEFIQNKAIGYQYHKTLFDIMSNIFNCFMSYFECLEFLRFLKC